VAELKSGDELKKSLLLLAKPLKSPFCLVNDE
jgi:hypothetical protein